MKICSVTIIVVSLLALLLDCSSTLADDRDPSDQGLLKHSYEQVVAFLGANPVERTTGETYGTEWVKYSFRTQGWDTEVLFVNGAAKGFTTQKSDLSPLTDREISSIFEAYDLPWTGLNDAYRGWRTLSETHFVHRNGRVHIIKHFASIAVVLTDFLSYYD